MKIDEFLKKCLISNRDETICLTVYKNVDKTEQQWEKELKPLVSFSKKESSNVESDKQKDEDEEKGTPSFSKEEVVKKIEEKKKRKNNN